MTANSIDYRSFLGWDAFSGHEGSGHTPQHGVIGLDGPVGVVLDYSSSVPRLRGITLTQGENMRLMALGDIDSGFDDISGQLSVQFRF